MQEKLQLMLGGGIILELKESDWASGADVPDATKSAYATYRGKLRDLPTTLTKPAYSTLDNQTEKQMVDHMDTLMPTKPS